jgi:hypothetical protein
MMETHVLVGVTPAMRHGRAIAINRVARAGLDWVVGASAALRPNPAFNRTCRGSASFLCSPLWRHAG